MPISPLSPTFRIAHFACLTAFLGQLAAPLARADIFPGVKGDACRLYVEIDSEQKRHFSLACNGMSDADARAIVDPSIGRSREELIRRMDEAIAESQKASTAGGLMATFLAAAGVGVASKFIDNARVYDKPSPYALNCTKVAKAGAGPGARATGYIMLIMLAGTVIYGGVEAGRGSVMAPYIAIRNRFIELIDDQDYALTDYVLVRDVADSLSTLLKRPAKF
jgi:hypothetical protein